MQLVKICSHRRATLLVIETFAYALWIGTAAAFAFIFAPIAFHIIGNIGIFAQLISEILTTISELGCVLAVTTLCVLVFLYPGNRRSVGIRALCSVVLLLSAGTERYFMIPRMNGLFHSGIAATQAHQRYQNLHHISSVIFSTALFCTVVALVLTVFERSEIRQDTPTP